MNTSDKITYYQVSTKRNYLQNQIKPLVKYPLSNKKQAKKLLY